MSKQRICIKTVALLAIIISLTGCANSIKVLQPTVPSGATRARVRHPITFELEFHNRANVSTFHASVDGTDITSSFTPSPVRGGRSSAIDPLPMLAQGPHVLTIRADMSPGRAFDGLGRDVHFDVIQNPTQPPPPQPSPSITMMVTPATASVVWGQAAQYNIDLTSRNGFAGPVSVTIDQLPANVTSSLSANTVNLSSGSSQRITANITPPFAGVVLGTSRFRIQATSSVRTVTQNASLSIVGTNGVFDRVPVLGTNSNCGANVQATYRSVGLNDVRVTFTVNRAGSAVQSDQIPAAFYALPQRDCRIGIVMHPMQNRVVDPQISWYNLGWETTTGAGSIPDRIRELGPVNWHQFWLSPDRSLLLIIEKAPQSLNCPPPCPVLDLVALVYNTITGDREGSISFRSHTVGQSADPVANITGASLLDGTVTINYVDPTNNPTSIRIRL